MICILEFQAAVGITNSTSMLEIWPITLLFPSSVMASGNPYWFIKTVSRRRYYTLMWLLVVLMNQVLVGKTPKRSKEKKLRKISEFCSILDNSLKFHNLLHLFCSNGIDGRFTGRLFCELNVTKDFFNRIIRAGNSNWLFPPPCRFPRPFLKPVSIAKTSKSSKEKGENKTEKSFSTIGCRKKFMQI